MHESTVAAARKTLGGFWILAVLIAPLALARHEEGGNYARVGVVDGGLYAQFQGEEDLQILTRNTPVYPGMYLVTEAESRASIELSEGSTLFLDANTALEVEALGFETSPEAAVLHLDRGGLLVQKARYAGDILVYASEGHVRLLREGLYRIDVFEEGDVRVTTLEGTAKVSSGADVAYVDAGYRTHFSPFGEIDTPAIFRERADSLVRWARNQGYLEYFYDGDPDYETAVARYGFRGASVRYAYELAAYGTWQYYPVYGSFVWIPRNVPVSWRPYHNGYWRPTPVGYFWASYEPWGWMPYHYGRWVWATDFGWCWVPGRTFAPAWVSWSTYGNTVGWCPLGLYGRPATTYVGFSVGTSYHSGWTFAPAGSFFHISLPFFSFSYGHIRHHLPASMSTCNVMQIVNVINQNGGGHNPPENGPPGNRPPGNRPPGHPHGMEGGKTPPGHGAMARRPERGGENAASPARRHGPPEWSRQDRTERPGVRAKERRERLENIDRRIERTPRPARSNKQGPKPAQPRQRPAKQKPHTNQMLPRERGNAGGRERAPERARPQRSSEQRPTVLERVQERSQRFENILNKMSQRVLRPAAPAPSARQNRSNPHTAQPSSEARPVIRNANPRPNTHNSYGNAGGGGRSSRPAHAVRPARHGRLR
jgi:hypothetical protein